MENTYILVINPGSTSTKLALFNNEDMLCEENIFHSVDILKKYPSIMSQYDYRKNSILDFIKKKEFNLEKLSCIVSRGGLTKPVQSGVYAINEEMLTDLKHECFGEHASNLGPLIAYSLAKKLKIPSYIVDPVVVDELSDIARISGYKNIHKISIFHALNHKAVAKEVAQSLNKTYEKCNFIVTHMGGGITIGAHKQGKVIDVNNGFDGEGPFTPERTGTLPFGAVIDFCIKNHHLTKKEIMKTFIGKGGLVSYFNTNSGLEIDMLIQNGNNEAKLVVEAMAYNVAKFIVAQLVPLNGKCDAIILTGGLVKWKYFVNNILSKLEWLNIPKKTIAGEQEMQALAKGALRALTKEEEVKIYSY